MYKLLDPELFVGKTFALKSIGDDDYRVDIAGHTAGRIFKLARAERRFVWYWTITGPECVGAGLASHGDCETITDARQEFRKTFDRWLEWARGSREGAGWHE
jgi:hypothetical protein